MKKVLDFAAIPTLAAQIEQLEEQVERERSSAIEWARSAPLVDVRRTITEKKKELEFADDPLLALEVEQL